MRLLLPALSIAILLSPACKKLEPKPPQETLKPAQASDTRRIRQACGSQESYERLKALAFEKAREIRAGDSARLDRLAAAAVVRMESPVAKSRDDALNVTVCKGRLVIELPPGAEDAFNGERRLTADVEYAAQAAIDGSGLVYQLDGAEPIIYRLAAIDLKGGAAPPAAAEPVEAQAAALPAPPPAPPPPPRAAPTARLAPASQPARAEPPVRLARPSFNCRYARTRSERMICADERLAARDRAMAALYHQAIAENDPETRAILADSRDDFLARRERCREAACVAEAYEDRMDEIDRIASGR